MASANPVPSFLPKILRAFGRRIRPWLVPGLAFDAQGHRLGRGGGYYDRLLAGVAGPRIGVARDWQILPSVPAEAHDIRLTVVVSEERILYVASVPDAPQLRKEIPCPISPNPSPASPPLVPSKS